MVTTSPLVGWVSLAGFEVDEQCADIVWALQEPALSYQFSEVDVSPPGKRWFRILVDESLGDWRGKRTAWALLWSLLRSAEAGHLSGFRVIHGKHFISEDAPDPEISSVFH